MLDRCEYLSACKADDEELALVGAGSKPGVGQSRVLSPKVSRVLPHITRAFTVTTYQRIGANLAELGSAVLVWDPLSGRAGGLDLYKVVANRHALLGVGRGCPKVVVGVTIVAELDDLQSKLACGL